MTPVAAARRSSPDRGLKKLAEETGGGFFLLKKEDELGPTFTRVAQELHSQYVLGFSPATLDGKVHKLEVKLKKPGLNARARKSYVASKTETGSTEITRPDQLQHRFATITSHRRLNFPRGWAV